MTTNINIANLLNMQRSGLKLAGTSFENIGLNMPPHLDKDKQMALKYLWEQELKHQEDNPPALPPSQVEPLPPKEITEEYHHIPSDAEDHVKEHLREKNDNLSRRNRAIERERNNQAAKKSRLLRLESLNVTRQMLNDKTAECAWMRLKIIQLGGSTAEWDNIGPLEKKRMNELVESRVKASDLRLAEEKKREESRQRAERNKIKAASGHRERANAMPSQQGFPYPPQTPHPQVSRPSQSGPALVSFSQSAMPNSSLPPPYASAGATTFSPGPLSPLFRP